MIIARCRHFCLILLRFDWLCEWESDTDSRGPYSNFAATSSILMRNLTIYIRNRSVSQNKIYCVLQKCASASDYTRVHCTALCWSAGECAAHCLYTWFLTYIHHMNPIRALFSLINARGREYERCPRQVFPNPKKKVRYCLIWERTDLWRILRIMFEWSKNQSN